MQAVSLAGLFEEKNFPHTQRWRTTPPAPIAATRKMYFHPTTKNMNHTPRTQSPIINPPLLPTPSKPKFMRKLSPIEIQFRRENNLCFLTVRNLLQATNVMLNIFHYPIC